MVVGSCQRVTVQMRNPLITLACVCAALWGGGLAFCSCFVLERTASLSPGVAAGTAFRSDSGGAASFVKVNIDGTASPHRGSSDGSFRVGGLSTGTWVLRLMDDETGDGIPERAAVALVSVVADSQRRPAGVLLGAIALEPTSSLGGFVVDSDGAPLVGATVVVFRTGADLGAVDVGTLQSEGSCATDDEGAFFIGGLASGALRVFAFTSALASEVQLLARAAGEVRITAVPIGARPTSVTLGFGMDDQANRAGDIDVWFMPAGQRPSGNPQRLRLGTTPTVALDPGLFDVFAVRVQGAAQGVLLGQTAPAGAVTSWGLMLLLNRDPCAVGGDVDGDGVVGLPRVDFGDLADAETPLDRRQREEAKRALWASCALPCLADPSAVFAVCDVDRERFDCDDDGDGQPDISEDAACLGACGSTDLDLDRECDRIDRSPPCSDSKNVCVLPVPLPLPEYLGASSDG